MIEWTRTTATLEAKPGWRNMFSLFADAVLSGGGTGTGGRKVRLYVGDDGHVYRRAGWLATLLRKRQRDPEA